MSSIEVEERVLPTNQWEEEYQVLKEFLCGNRDSVDAIYRSMYPQLKNFLRKFQPSTLLQEEDLDDLVSLTLTTALENFEKYDCTMSSYRTWVYGIGKNLKRNALKAASKKQKSDSVFDERRLYHDLLSIDPLESLLREELFMTVRRAFSFLSEEERALILQKLEEKKTFQDLGRMYGVSSTTMFHRYHLAIRFFRYQFMRLYYQIC